MRRLLRRRSDVIEANLRISPYTGLRDVLPSSPGDRKYLIWEQLLELDRILYAVGPANEDVRKHIRDSANRIRLQFVREKPRNADEVAQYFHVLKLLVDIGVDDVRQLHRLQEYSAEVVAYHLRTGDRCGLVRAVLNHANTLRLQGWESKGKRLMRYALRLVEEIPEKADPRQPDLHHLALFHHLRFFVNKWDWAGQQKIMNEIIQRARHLHRPGARLETFREAVRHYGSHGDLDLARKYHGYVEELLEKHSFPKYGLQCLLRPMIHALLATRKPRDREEAISMIERYHLMYLTDKHCYYYAQLLRWKEQLGLSYDLPEPTYGAMILTYLPREKPDAL